MIKNKIKTIKLGFLIVCILPTFSYALDKEDILDYMSSTELAANLFRITQTDEVLKNKNINNEDDACKTHHNVGQAVRQTIKRIGGTMPEDLPTPAKSAKQIESEKNKLITENKK